MRIFLVLSRCSKNLQQPVFSTFQTMLLLVTVDAASLLFALVFLMCRSNINMFQVKKFSLMNICTAGPTKAPVKKSPNNCVRKKTTITKCKGVPVPMERIWAQLGFTTSLCHHQLQCHQNHSGDQKLFSLL